MCDISNEFAYRTDNGDVPILGVFVFGSCLIFYVPLFRRHVRQIVHEVCLGFFN